MESVRDDGNVPTVPRMLFLLFGEGYFGDGDLAADTIRLTRQLAASVDHPEVQGLLALMLLHHARHPARTNDAGRPVPLAGPRAGLAALAGLDPALHRHTAALAYLHERDGDPATAARLYAAAALAASNLPEREHLTRQAA